MLFPNITSADLNKCIDKKVVLCTYNSLYIPQIGICKITLTYKDIESQCSLFVVPRYGPALLEIPDCVQCISFKYNNTDVAKLLQFIVCKCASSINNTVCSITLTYIHWRHV